MKIQSSGHSIRENVSEAKRKAKEKRDKVVAPVVRVRAGQLMKSRTPLLQLGKPSHAV